jgi:hypothetical protein
LAVSLGLNARVVHYLLMALIAAYTVAAFEAVGSILVVAMLVVPAATAYLLTDRLRWMAVLAALAGASAAFFGRWCAWELETSVAGMMAVVAGGNAPWRCSSRRATGIWPNGYSAPASACGSSARTCWPCFIAGASTSARNRCRAVRRWRR